MPHRNNDDYNAYRRDRAKRMEAAGLCQVSMWVPLETAAGLDALKAAGGFDNRGSVLAVLVETALDGDGETTLEQQKEGAAKRA